MSQIPENSPEVFGMSKIYVDVMLADLCIRPIWPTNASGQAGYQIASEEKYFHVVNAERKS
jgi:hypothetical protein